MINFKNNLSSLDMLNEVTVISTESFVKGLTSCEVFEEEKIGDIISIASRLDKRGLTNSNRWANFLGQCIHESSHFNLLEENLNYSAEVLVKVWPSRFDTKTKIKNCTRNPEALANYVYGGRMGNNMNGDGWKYRGRGPIGLTGKDNYLAASDYLGFNLVDDPDLVSSDLQIGLMVAIWFFETKSYKGVPLLELCDVNDFKSITKCINGGLNGYADRLNFTSLLLEEFSGIDITARSIAGNGASGVHVKEIQDMLMFLGYLPNSRSSRDGAYGPMTTKAIRDFQNTHQLTPTGILTVAVYRVLLNVYTNKIVSL